MRTVERAVDLFARGNHRAALVLLRPLATADRPPFRTRLALAEVYRAMRNPDQAGRWGIAAPGWTTALERDRLARLLASSGVTRETVANFLQLPEDLPASEDLENVLVAMDGYAALRRAEWQVVPRRPRLPRVLSAVMWALLGVTGFLLFSTLFIVLGFALLGADHVQATASNLIGCVWIGGGSGILVGAAARFAERRVIAGLLMAVAGLVSGVIGSLYLLR